MEYTFTTNSRVISKLLVNYRNTFLAFCELINNSIQAKAKEIRVTIDQAPDEILKEARIYQVTLRDNGYGVSETEFRKKIFEIGTDVKTGGRGVGRFASFQLGALVDIETVGFDNIKSRFVKTSFQINHSDLGSKELEKVKLNVRHQDLSDKEESYYQVIINEFWDTNAVSADNKKKVNKNLLIENIEEALFLQYPIHILNNEVAFYVNENRLQKEHYVIGDPETRSEIYTDQTGIDHPVDLTFINYKSTSKGIKVFLRTLNNDIKTIAHEYNYAADIPDQNSWVVYVDSEIFDLEESIFRNIISPDLFKDSQHLLDNIQLFIDKFFKEKFKDYFNFSKKLRDDVYYPYRQKSASSQSKVIVFNQLAYFIEKEHKVLSKNEKIRKIVYPLIDKAISHRELWPIIEQTVSLKNESITKFRDLLERTDLEDVVFFSEDVAQKRQFLEFLNQIIYGQPSKHIKERSQLHKIVEKHLWLFGEQYKDTPVLFSDKSLKNNLKTLRDELFTWEPDTDAENIIDVDESLKDITDLFFFNEKVLDDEKHEVMVVELKRPSCRISEKELRQVDRYQFKIEESGRFSQEIHYKIILISSDLTRFAKSKVGADDRNPYLYSWSKKGNIFTYVIKWADLIHATQRKLSYLGNILNVKDQDIRDVFEKDYPEIEISDLISELTVAQRT